MKFKIFTALLLLGANLSAADDSTPMQYRSGMNQQQPASGPCKYDCSSLPAQQKDFAMKLSPLHKSLFCGQFTPQQRVQAMGMTKAPQGKTAMSPDEAVEEVMKNSRGVGQGKQQQKKMQGQNTAPAQRPSNIY